MKPKRIPQQSSFQGFSKTEGRPIGFIFESFCPEVIESEKPRFLQEYELLEVLFPIESFVLIKGYNRI